MNKLFRYTLDFDLSSQTFGFGKITYNVEEKGSTYKVNIIEWISNGKNSRLRI